MYFLKQILFVFILVAFVIIDIKGQQQSSSITQSGTDVFLFQKALQLQKDSRFDSAILYFNEAFVLYEEQDDQFNKIRCLNEISKCNRRLYKLHEAKIYADSCINLTIDKLGEDHLLLADCYDNIGIIGVIDKNSPMTLEYLKRSLNIKLKNYDENSETVGDSYRYIGIYLDGANDTIESIKYLIKALNIYQNALGPKHEKIASINNSIGLYYKRIYGHNEKALKYYLKALEIYRSNFGEVDFRVAGISNNIALAYQILNNLEQAEKYLLSALAIQEKILGSNNPDMGMTYYNLASFYLETKNYNKALEYLQLSMIVYMPGFNDTDPHSNPTFFNTDFKRDLFIPLKTKPEAWFGIYLQTGDTNALISAVNTCLLTTQLVDEFYKCFYDVSEKLILSDYTTHVYRNGTYYAGLLYELTKDPKDLEMAFTFAGKHKARLLANTFLNINDQVIGEIHDSIVNFENKFNFETAALRYKISKYKSKDNNIEPDENVQMLEDSIFMLKSKYKKLEKIFMAQYPQYYDLKNRVNEISIQQLQSILDTNETILQYMTIDLEQLIQPDKSSFIAIFMIQKDKAELKLIEIDNDFRNKIHQIRNNILNQKFESSAIQEYKNIAYEVYKKTIEPFAKEITNNDLIIIPDGLLSTLPFGILINAPSDSINQFKELPYLIKNHSIVYNYSSSLYYYSLLRNNNNEMKNFLALAPSFEDQEKTIGPLYAERGDEYINLSGAKSEVLKINQLLDGKAIIGDAATKKYFIENACNYQVLHLATHSFIDVVNPMNSRILFSKEKESEKYGELFAYDLFTTKLNAEMAVLSTCSSGFGKIHNSEGILSLARNFIFAGIPNVVMSLWNINDNSSSTIMQSFYQNLKENIAKDAALRDAKLHFIENSDNIMSHPYYWGGIVIIGNQNPLVVSPGHKWDIIFLVGIIIIIGLIVIIWAYKRKWVMKNN